MLLGNLNPPKLCNGSRLIITNLQNNLIEAKILTGICGIYGRRSHVSQNTTDTIRLSL